MFLESQSLRPKDRRGLRSANAAHRAAAALWPLIPLLAGCHHDGYTVAADAQQSLQLTSSSVQDGKIPKKYTCEGADISPELAWTAPPAATKSFALIVTDPDAPSGTFTHWVLYNIPAGARSLAAGLPRLAQLADGPRQGRNDFGKPGYGGPCPPRGTEHRYIFTLYALGTSVDLPLGATREQVERAIKGHVLAQGELTARYGR